ncbi:hypothetical protein [Haloarcula sp. 1CSR25-25]|uniref:hypothetical protein n=1 Tax=Haloarcula sp. 1CSR25-25 TaxID=2862545 RepID=UPI0028945D89|nr:hypothetical protein [Haloarcula sp. 1CSR25-25]MDT3435465.1 hypothetical protein [Haloarcula sp. 1CSR25-25]
MADLFDIFDRYLVEVRGDGPSVNKLRKTFDRFATHEQEREPDIICDLTHIEPDPKEVFGAPDEYYGREGDRFIIKKPEGYGHLSINTSWDHVAMSPDVDHYLVAYIVEFEVRKRLAADGYALIHASGVQFDETAVLFPAWRYTGKTNTMMTLLNSGADYLSDDRLWVGTDRSVLGYPVPINMMVSNLETYPGLSDLSRIEQFRSYLVDLINDRIDQDRSIFDKLAYFGTKFYLDPNLGRRLISVDQLIPTADFVDKTTVSSVVSLRTRLDGSNVEVKKVPGKEALADISAISLYEWNRDLEEYFATFDALFSSSKTEELDKLIAKEEQNLNELFNHIETYRALIPREQDWKSTGIADEIQQKLGNLDSSTDVGHSATKK